jgi:hypothetical protein
METTTNEYIQNNSPDLITEKLNEYYKTRNSKIDDDLKEAAYNLLAREDW